jgi:hypothetical protein
MMGLQVAQAPERSREKFQTTWRDPLVGEFASLKEAFVVAFWEPDSRDEVLRVLERAADDPDFIAQLTRRGSEALSDYHLSAQAKAALISGDVRWIQGHVGKLDERLMTWLDCRLGQEIW